MVSNAARPVYQPTGGHLALDLCNSIGRSPGRFGREHLVDHAHLTTWCLEAGCLPPERAAELQRAAAEDPEGARRALARAHALREASQSTFTARMRSEAPPPSDLATINAELARAHERLQVESTDAGARWSWRSDPLDLAEPLWPLARAVAELLTSADAERLHECASESCLWLFLDHSRNQRRRWCDMRSCGNLAKVRAHRRRKRGTKS